MKRLNPKTNSPFKSGDAREDGKIFYGYAQKRLKKDGFFTELWLSPEAHKKHRFDSQSGDTRTISNFATGLISAAKDRCKGCPSRTKSGRLPTNGKVTITKQWVMERLEKGICEATGDQLTIKPKRPNTASLDRIDGNNPDYTPENCRIVTWQFNNMKGAYSDEEFIRVAKQLEITKQKSAPPVSKRTNLKGIDNSQLRTDVGSGFGEDNYYSHHYSGTISGENTDHSTQASSGNSMGLGSKEVGTSKIIESLENYGQPRPTYDWLEY